MLSLNCANAMIKSARWLGVGVLMAALPLSITASTVGENFSILLNGVTGNGSFSYDTSKTTSDGDGPYADYNDGLTSFNLTYSGTTYIESESLDYETLPAVYLPGNSTIPAGLTYGILAAWVLNGSGSCTATSVSPAGDQYTCAGPGGVGGATILGVGRSAQSFLYEDVVSAEIDYTGSNVTYAFGTNPVKIYGTLSESAVPEPAVIPVLALGLAGLLFARRRKAIL
jgi:hypothetical protein